MICVLLSVGFPQHDSAREDEGGVAVVVGAAVGDVDEVVFLHPPGLHRGRIEVVDGGQVQLILHAFFQRNVAHVEDDIVVASDEFQREVHQRGGGAVPAQDGPHLSGHKAFDAEFQRAEQEAGLFGGQGHGKLGVGGSGVPRGDAAAGVVGRLDAVDGGGHGDGAAVAFGVRDGGDDGGALLETGDAACLHRDDVLRRSAPKHRLVGGVRGRDGDAEVGGAEPGQLQSVLAQSHLLDGDDVRLRQGRGRRGVPQLFQGSQVVLCAAAGVAGGVQQLEQKGFFLAAQPAEAVGAHGVDGQCAGGGIHLHHPHQLARLRQDGAGRCPDVQRVQPDRAAPAVDAQDSALAGRVGGRTLGSGLCLFGVACGQRGAGGGLLGRGCRLAGALLGVLLAGGRPLGGLGGGVGAGDHPGDELLVDRGRQLLAPALGGEDVVDVILAGPGVGGVALAVGGGQHPLAAGPAGEAAAHPDAARFVQLQRLSQCAVGVADVEGDDAPGPLPGQGKFQPVHAFGLLCAQMQPVGLGEKFGAAEVPGGNVDLHGENSFRLVLHLA